MTTPRPLVFALVVLSAGALALACSEDDGNGGTDATATSTSTTAPDATEGDTATTTGTEPDATEGDATGIDMSAVEPPAPVVEAAAFSCAALPAALEGDDPLNTKFWFEFDDARGCVAGDDLQAAAGGLLELEYYIDTDFSNMQALWTRSFDGVYQLVGCSEGELLVGVQSDPVGCSGLTPGAEITMTLTDVVTETETVEIVFVIEAPWVAILSVTAL